MNTCMKLTNAERLKIRRFLERIEWILWNQRESCLALQILKGMFRTIEDLFIKHPYSNGKIVRLFSIMESRPLNAQKRDEGLSILKALLAYYGIDGATLSLGIVEDTRLGEVVCHD